MSVNSIAWNADNVTAVAATDCAFQICPRHRYSAQEALARALTITSDAAGAAMDRLEKLRVDSITLVSSNGGDVHSVLTRRR